MTHTPLLDAVARYWGYTTLRPLQREAMDTVLAGRDSIVVLPTGGGKSLPLKDFAGLTREGAFLNKKHTYSYGTHVAHVAVDPKLGQVHLLEYLVIQDVGRAINPLTLRGQIIGSLVQGLGGAMLDGATRMIIPAIVLALGTALSFVFRAPKST